MSESKFQEKKDWDFLKVFQPIILAKSESKFQEKKDWDFVEIFW